MISILYPWITLSIKTIIDIEKIIPYGTIPFFIERGGQTYERDSIIFQKAGSYYGYCGY